jgi:hypothetical protein
LFLRHRTFQGRIHVEHGIEPGKPEQMLDSFSGIHQDKIGTCLSRGGEPAYKRTESAAVDMMHIREINDDVFTSQINNFPDPSSESLLIRFTEKIAADVYDAAVGLLFDIDMHLSSFRPGC